MKIMVVGPGAFGVKHIEGISQIDGAEVVSLVGHNEDKANVVAQEYDISHVEL